MPNTTTVDEELYDGLQQARKRKPRNFCLVAKGLEVVKLIVRKKKINEAQAQKAKSEAKGTLVVMGVVVGEGMELSFQIVGSEPSITPKKIRDFISEQTDLTLKPRWTVVPELQEVEEEGEETPLPAPKKPTQPPTSTSPPTSGPPPTPPPPPPTSSSTEPPPPAPPPPKTDLLGEMVAKMKKLTPAIQAAVQAHPQRKDDLLQQVAAFKAQVKAKDEAGAQQSLKDVAALLKELKDQGGSPPPPVPPPPPSRAPSQPETMPQAKQEQEERESEKEEQQPKSEAETKVDEFKQNWAAARKNLREAIDKVEGQLAGLAEALLKSNDPNMIWVAEEGLTQLLGGLRASATTIDKSASKTPAKVVAFARPAIAELEKRLDSPQIKVCDQNKFGVKVSVKKTIEAAIDELVKTLESAV